MTKTIEVKECESCQSKMHNVDIRRQYCDDCRKKLYKKHAKKYKSRISSAETERKRKMFEENFNNIIKEPYQLTTVGFDEVSEIPFKSYQNYHRLKWIEIINLYGKKDELIKYIVNEYKLFYKENGKKNFKHFTDDHKYIGIQLMKTIGFDFIKKMAGIEKSKKYNLEDCKNEFNRLIDMFGRVPLYQEFLDNTQITIKVFVRLLDIKGKVYDNLVKSLVSEELYQSYNELRKEHKANLGRENHQGYKYSDQDLEDNFKCIFDKHYKEFGTYPTWRLFDEMSPISESVYTHRFNKTWLDVCEVYGYEVERTNNKSEKVALEVVKSILGEDYIPQKTFDWLRGINNFPLFCDGYFPNHNLIIEFDGKQHREPIEHYGGWETFNTTRANDKYKEALSSYRGIKLIRITSEEPFWNKDYIKHKLIYNGVKLTFDQQNNVI